MVLGEEALAFPDFDPCLRFVLARGEAVDEFPKFFLSLFDGSHIPVNRLNQLKMTEGQPVLRVRGQDVIAVQVQKMLIFDDRFRVPLFFMKRFRSFQDDVGIIVHFDGVPDKNLGIGSLGTCGRGRRLVVREH